MKLRNMMNMIEAVAGVYSDHTLHDIYDKEVQILTPDGLILDLNEVVYDEENGVTFLKCTWRR
jgi:hypothetical protein